MQTVRDAFGGVAAKAWSGYNRAVERVIELAGGDGSSSVHYYNSEAYREAVEAGQVEPGTDVVIGEDTGNGQDDYTAFTHIDGDSAPAIAAEETPEFYEALSRRPGLRMGEPVDVSLVEGGILDQVVQAFETPAPESVYDPGTITTTPLVPGTTKTLSEILSQRPGVRMGESVDISFKQSVRDMAESLVANTSEISDAVLGKAASVFESFNETMDQVSFREYTSFIGNFVNPGRTITEANLGEPELEAMRQVVADARSRGLSAVDYLELGTSEKDAIDGPGLFGGIADPMVRIQRVVGGFKFFKNDEGETMVENTYNFNGVPGRNRSRVGFYEAYKNSDFEEMARIAWQLKTQPVSFASVLGYVRQEELKAAGEPYETEMVINLGVID
ncbi:hypothetical protein N9778_00415 [Hyphomicrobiales bacterium]|nr:hypothetical protein [Hyphomicrobiales bacterium]